jgi:hypothetical protein
MRPKRLAIAERLKPNASGRIGAKAFNRVSADGGKEQRSWNQFRTSHAEQFIIAA